MDTIKVLSFNILADAPIWKKKWEHLPKEKWIYWDYRKGLILDVITKTNPDVMCLLEIQYNQIGFFAEQLGSRYNYIYTSGEPKRTAESAKKYKDWSDSKGIGIMVLFKKDKIRIIHNHALNYDLTFRTIGANESWEGMKINHFLKPCASNTILFEIIDKNKRFYFTALHHFNDPNYGDVKYYQMFVLLQNIVRMNRFDSHPEILCGDFNAMPDSAVVQLVKTGKLTPDTLYEPEYKIPEENIKKIGLPETLDQYNVMQSVHEVVYGAEPKYTTLTEHFSECIDYVFVSKGVKVLGMDPVDQVIGKWKDQGIHMPNKDFPSDHINLVAELEIGTSNTIEKGISDSRVRPDTKECRNCKDNVYSVSTVNTSEYDSYDRYQFIGSNNGNQDTIDISHGCVESYPCYHNVRINDGNWEDLNGREIYDLFFKRSAKVPDHFAKYEKDEDFFI